MAGTKYRWAAPIAVSAAAGAACGLAIGVAVAVLRCSVASIWDGTGRTFRDAPSVAGSYGIGGVRWGALCGMLDFAITALRRKAVSWPANALLWAFIAGSSLGVTVAFGEHSGPGIGQMSAIMLACCCVGATFGATVAIARRPGTWTAIGRWLTRRRTRRARALIASAAVVLALACYVWSFSLVRKPITLSRFTRDSKPPPGNLRFLDTLVYYFSKDDRVNFCMWYFYWPIERASGMDRRSLADRIAEPADAEHNGPLPTYVRDLDELRAMVSFLDR